MRKGATSFTLIKKSLNVKGNNYLKKLSSQEKKSNNKPVQISGIEKKISFVQRNDGSIGIMDEFNDMLMTQDIIEGSWNENQQTKKLVNKVKKEKSKNINEYRLVINKGKRFLISKGFNYDEEIKKINL